MVNCVWLWSGGGSEREAAVPHTFDFYSTAGEFTGLNLQKHTWRVVINVTANAVLSIETIHFCFRNLE